MRTSPPASGPSRPSEPRRPIRRSVANGAGLSRGRRWRAPPLALSLGLVAACASSPGRPAQPAESAPRPPAPGAERVERGQTPPPADVQRPWRLAPELERFAQSVRALEDQGPDPSQHRLLRALHDAADAVEAVEPERAGTAAELRTAAARIEASGGESRVHAGALRAGLVATLEQLQERRARGGDASRDARADGARADRGAEAKAPAAAADARAPVDAVALDAALAELARHAAALDASRPLLEQRRVVGDSLRALGDAVFLAAGHDAPFGARAPAPRSVGEVLDQARADVLALGRADLSNLRELAARAMHSIADGVEALGERESVARPVLEIRAEAERLKGDDSGPFARAGWVERGLETALDALDALEPCRAALVAGWTQAARRAAAQLPERGALPFQHAAMQDAFRATVDALGVAMLGRDTCGASRQR